MRGQVMKKMINLKFIKSPNSLLREDDIRIVANEILKGELNVFLALKEISSADFMYGLSPEDDLQALLLAGAKLAMKIDPCKHSQVNSSIEKPYPNLPNIYSSNCYSASPLPA